MADRETKTIVRLRHALRSELGVEAADSLEEAKEKPVCLKLPNLRLESHFRLPHDLLVYDRCLGSLGVVHVVRGEPGAATDLVSHATQQAGYARYLFCRRVNHDDTGGMADKSGTAINVEVVFIVEDKSRNGTRLMRAVSERLKRLARDGPLLHDVGVHVLRASRVDHPVDIRQGFCWLLQATRAWYGHVAQDRLGKEVRRLREFTLQNFRLPGERVLKLEPAARVHIISGRNGSGKTALSESFELALSGSIERLNPFAESAEAELPPTHGPDVGRESSTDYRQTLMNRDSKGRLEITADFLSAEQWSSEIGERGLTLEGLEPQVDADSFRLDQRLMDRLMSARPAARMRTFATAFFPQETEQPLLEEWDRAALAEKTARQAVEHRLASLRSSKEVLEELRSWTFKTRTAAKVSHARVLNEWLELRALEDLLVRADTIRRTQQTAGRPRKGTSLREEARSVLSRMTEALGDADEVPGILGRIGKEHQRKLELLNTLTPTRKTSTRSRKTTGRLLSADEVRELNDAGLVLVPSGHDSTDLGLGDAIARALTAATYVTFSNTTVGRSDWTKPILARLDKTVSLYQSALDDEEDELRWSGDAAEPAEYEALRIARRERLAADAALEESFFRHFLPAEEAATSTSTGSEPPRGLLWNAVQETVALLTPARWAYPPIRPRFEPGSEAIELHFEASSPQANAPPRRRGAHGATPIHLIWNTAELNTFTLALFLLCAVRVRNAFDLLVLDDPLQNMDELTVTSLARGVSRVVRIWDLHKLSTSILLLLHGESAASILRREIPSAAYELPWLTEPADPIEPIKHMSNPSIPVQGLDPPLATVIE